jgi:transglutaminase-like putative cysteine protease
MADMQLNIRHETVYRYAETVAQSVQMLRLTPRTEARQRTISWQIAAPGRRSFQRDAHGNITQLLTLEEPHREIRIVVSGIVETFEPSGPQFDHEPLSPLVYLPPTALTTPGEPLRALSSSVLGDLSAPGKFNREQLTTLAQAVCDVVRYRSGTTTVTDTALTALARGEGVCQDQAHVFLACCRLAGIPARYVSGYLYAGENQDVASHAWVDAWLETERAWVGIDVTHFSPAGAQHCRLAVGRDYHDAAPVRGVRRGGGTEALEVKVSVSLQDTTEQ